MKEKAALSYLLIIDEFFMYENNINYLLTIMSLDELHFKLTL